MLRIEVFAIRLDLSKTYSSSYCQTYIDTAESFFKD